MFHSSFFIYKYKIQTPYSHSFIFPYAHPPPVGCHPWKRPILPSCPSFFWSVYWYTLQAHTYHALIKLNPSHNLLIFYHHAPLLFNGLQYTHNILYSYIDGLLQYFSFANIFLFFPTSLVYFCSISHYIYIYMHVYMHIYDHIAIYI
jgi:hypothetical protein